MLRVNNKDTDGVVQVFLWLILKYLTPCYSASIVTFNM